LHPVENFGKKDEKEIALSKNLCIFALAKA
jgi:hypothetical protein